jgi:hypothetical protein
MSLINESTIAVLADYSFFTFNSKNPEILAIREKNGKKELTTLSRKDITALEVFKSLFGHGKLAQMHYSLSSVTKFLNESQEWKKFSKEDVTSQKYKAYLTVCEIAKRSLLKNHDIGLWKKISSPKAYSFENVQERITMHCSILINPTLDAQVLYQLMKLKFSGKRINDPNFGCNFKIYEQISPAKDTQVTKPTYKVLPNDRSIKIKEEDLEKTLVKLFGCYTLQWEIPGEIRL